MKISLAKSRLKTYIEEQMPSLLSGPPGVGKTELPFQITAENEWDILLSHPLTKSSVDYSGLPYCRNGVSVGGAANEPEALWLPYGDLKEMCKPKRKRRLVVVFDDVGLVPNMTQGVLMQIVHARSINEHKIGDQVSFVLCTNRKEDRSGVNGILEAFKNRMIIINVEPTLEDWADWARKNGVPDVVIAHARFYGERPDGMFNAKPISGDMVNRPTPRSVVLMGRQYSKGIDDAESLGGSVGIAYATDFAGFARMFKDLTHPDAIIASPLTAPVPTTGLDGKFPSAALYAIVTAVCLRANSKTGEAILKYLQRLPREYAMLGTRDVTRTFPGIRSTKTFIQMSLENAELAVYCNDETGLDK